MKNEAEIKKKVSQCMNVGDLIGACEILAGLASVNSTSVEYWNYLGCFLHENVICLDIMVKFSSIGAFKKAVSLDTSHANSWHNLGVGLMAAGMYDESLDCLNRCHKLSPSFQPAQEALNNFFSSYPHQRNTYCVSYPKCGRNWLKHALTKTLAIHKGRELTEKVGLDLLCNEVGVPNIVFTHDQGEWGIFRETRHLLPEVERRQMTPDWNNMKFNQRTFDSSKVLFIVRSPLDVLVSSYFQITRMCKSYQGSLSEFIQDPHFGIKKIINFYKIWDKNKEKSGDFLLVRYEEMQKDLFSSVQKICSFLGLNFIDDKSINKACELSSFKNMKKVLSKQANGNTDPEAEKIRRGKVGGYVDYLSSDDILYLYKVIREMKCPFYNFRYEKEQIALSW